MLSLISYSYVLKMLNFVSTPIGNLNDISLRAIDVIKSSDYLYAEDTRNVKKLLDFINVKISCKSFHEHNEKKVMLDILKKAKNSKVISIVSDAGTPSISDPGYKLITKCIAENIKYTLIPGPSSVISAMVMSGLPSNRFAFYGFVPRKIQDKKKFFEDLDEETKTSIIFESSRRVFDTLKNLADYLDSDRKVSICKEMTKIHENVIRGKTSEIFKLVVENQINLKGEIVIVIEGTSKKITASKINSRIKKEFLTKLSASESAKLISTVTGENKRDVYKKLIQT